MAEIRVEVEIGPFADKARERALSLPWDQAIAAARSVIHDEFNREAWRPPSGAAQPWQKTGPFGNEPAPAKTLQRSGSLLAAWLGGAGSFQRIEQQQASFGITGMVARIASVHRGQGTQADARVPTRIAVTPKMRVFLGVVKGVWLRKTTTHITIPKRVHATDNPETATRVTALFAAFVAGRPAPEGLTR